MCLCYAEQVTLAREDISSLEMGLESVHNLITVLVSLSFSLLSHI